MAALFFTKNSPWNAALQKSAALNIHREAPGNALEVVASGGTLLRGYPVIEGAEQPLSAAESLLKKLKVFSGVFGNMEVPDFLKS